MEELLAVVQPIERINPTIERRELELVEFWGGLGARGVVLGRKSKVAAAAEGRGQPNIRSTRVEQVAVEAAVEHAGGGQRWNAAVGSVGIGYHGQTQRRGRGCGHRVHWSIQALMAHDGSGDGDDGQRMR